MKVRLAYFGPPGTNTEEAALRYSLRQGSEYTLVPIPTITGVAGSVESGAADEGVMPIENTLEGAVPETLDNLIHATKPLFIRSEIVLPIEMYLLAKPGVSAGDVRVILSNPVALAQCRGFIEREFPKVRIEAALSTAAAVEQAVARDDAAAIGARRAAELYGAHVLSANIADRSPNHTRFVVVATSDHERTGDDRTSLAFAFPNEDRPGQLVGALDAFSQRGINLTKIESRPSKERLGTYIFLADIGGHREEPGVAEALAAVEEMCSWFKVLGSYPRYRS
jgi:prephenate dehydratase